MSRNLALLLKRRAATRTSTLTGGVRIACERSIIVRPSCPMKFTKIGGERRAKEHNYHPLEPLAHPSNSAVLKPILDLPQLSALPDEALLKKISQHHQPALDELYGRYGRTLKAVIDSV